MASAGASGTDATALARTVWVDERRTCDVRCVCVDLCDASTALIVGKAGQAVRRPVQGDSSGRITAGFSVAELIVALRVPPWARIFAIFLAV